MYVCMYININIVHVHRTAPHRKQLYMSFSSLYIGSSNGPADKARHEASKSGDSVRKS